MGPTQPWLHAGSMRRAPPMACEVRRMAGDSQPPTHPATYCATTPMYAQSMGDTVRYVPPCMASQDKIYDPNPNPHNSPSPNP